MGVVRPFSLGLGLVVVGLLSGARQAPPPDLQSGLIAHWKLDETSGAGAADSVGPNLGTHYPHPYGGPAITTAGLPPTIKFANPACLTFDGFDDFVDGGTNPALSPAALSVSFWTRNLGLPSIHYAGLLGKSNGISWTQGWGFFYEPADQINFFVGKWNDGVATSAIAATQWNHVVGTWDGSTVQVYVNGTAGASGTFSGSAASAYPFVIGILGDPYYTINGLIDDVRIYDRALAPQEISLLSQGYGGPPEAPTGLQAAASNGVTLNWDAVEQAESYTIRRSTTSGSGYSDVATGVTAPHYVDAGRPSGTYYYVVTAVNFLGSSPNSTEANATVSSSPTSSGGGSKGDDDSPCGLGTARVSGGGVLAALGLLALILSLPRRTPA
jgi:hypothetical protein